MSWTCSQQEEATNTRLGLHTFLDFYTTNCDMRGRFCAGNLFTSCTNRAPCPSDTRSFSPSLPLRSEPLREPCISMLANRTCLSLSLSSAMRQPAEEQQGRLPDDGTMRESPEQPGRRQTLHFGESGSESDDGTLDFLRPMKKQCGSAPRLQTPVKPSSTLAALASNYGVGQSTNQIQSIVTTSTACAPSSKNSKNAAVSGHAYGEALPKEHEAAPAMKAKNLTSSDTIPGAIHQVSSPNEQMVSAASPSSTSSLQVLDNDGCSISSHRALVETSIHRKAVELLDDQPKQPQSHTPTCHPTVHDSPSGIENGENHGKSQSQVGSASSNPTSVQLRPQQSFDPRSGLGATSILPDIAFSDAVSRERKPVGDMERSLIRPESLQSLSKTLTPNLAIAPASSLLAIAPSQSSLSGALLPRASTPAIWGSRRAMPLKQSSHTSTPTIISSSRREPLMLDGYASPALVRRCHESELSPSAFAQPLSPCRLVFSSLTRSTASSKLAQSSILSSASSRTVPSFASRPLLSDHRREGQAAMPPDSVLGQSRPPMRLWEASSNTMGSTLERRPVSFAKHTRDQVFALPLNDYYVIWADPVK
eukprot:scaffold301767_cov37-Tisochrysis_lutea.AAC.1